MIEVVTMSSRGQLVIPKRIRKEMGLQERDKFIIVRDSENVILRKIKRGQPDRKLLSLLDEFAKKFEEARISAEDVKEEIRKARARK
ncbi:MAG TPA: AbrB/MazE/SpoVT family DNA-binding domain-containing protein [Thermodesulfobacteriota bacterium]|nr:AbrB/MazE/SpoVT family DNA-binding domain-containing protein [Thermodesulfobacteriota bacterium]